MKKTLKDNLESKIKVLNKIIDEPIDSMYTRGRQVGMRDGLQYRLDQINNNPKWVRMTIRFIVFILSMLIGFLVGIMLNIKP